MRGAPWTEAAVLAITLAWGLSFVVIPHALEDAGVLTLTALRMSVGTAAGLLLLRPRILSADRRTWGYGLLGGACLTVAYVLQTAGLRTAGSGESAFLTAFYVTLVPILDAAVHRRWPSARDTVALSVATVGIGLIAVNPGARLHLGWGESLVALSAVFWAAQIVVVGRVAATADPGALAVIQIGVIAVVATAALPFFPEKPVRWSGELVSSIFFLGYVTCALAFAVQAWAQRKIPPTRAAILFSPEPVFAALAGWWFREESFGPRQLTGAALVVAAVVLVLLPPRRRGDAAGPVTSAA